MAKTEGIGMLSESTHNLKCYSHRLSKIAWMCNSGQFIPSAHRDESRTSVRRVPSIEVLQHEAFDSCCPRNFDRGSVVT